MSSLQAPPTGSLLNKAAIITGASRGIGAAIALELARCGAHIAIIYRSEASIKKAGDLTSRIQEMGRKACAARVDLLEVDSGRKIVEAARSGLKVDKIDILVNSAGSEAPPLTALEFDPRVFEVTMNTNVRAPMLLMQAVLPHLATRGGRVINISSTLARLPAPANLAIYASSKAALECLTRHWAFDLAAEYNMTVNTISIGIVDTDSSAHYSHEERVELQQLPSAEKRLGTVEDVAPVAAFLASERARWINGATISCNGGSLFM